MKNGIFEKANSGKCIGTTFYLLFFTEDRVKIGLANARAKGKLIGRKKLRDSDLIRKLLKAGMTYRQVGTIAKCSHGSVHQEKLAMKRDEELAKKKLLEAPVEGGEEAKIVFPEIPKIETKN